ncbi:MAG: Crp/Fnr family transcriptional regulator [Caldilineaceae bacterium]|nr:Crp/Fnr family transcriptional regulator [Caldilineaceae bacterium]
MVPRPPSTLHPMMPHLLLIGCWEQAVDRLAALVEAGQTVTWQPASADPLLGCDLVIARLEEQGLIPRLPAATPWIAWNVHDDPALALAAYAGKAALVLPGATSAPLLVQSIEQGLVASRQTVPRSSGEGAVQRLYERGEVIRFSPDAILEIEEGLVAQTVIHPDGAEVLLGLFGPGQLLAPHPEDDCLIQLRAHTEATIHSEPWETASRRPDFAVRLRTRLWQMEAWASMQARPYLADRLLGILTILAEQFGRPQPDGVLIDIRITHAQLAAAVGANRTTITRLVSELRRRNVLTTTGHGQDERFCLLQWQQSHHDFRRPVAIATLR